MQFLNRIDRKVLIIGGAALLIVVVGLGIFLMRDTLFPKAPVAVMGEPIDVVLDFYTPWLEAVQATTTDPYTAGLSKSLVLGVELRKQIRAAKGDELDPVLCQTRIPTQVTGRTVSQLEEKAEVLVVSRDKGSTEQAIVTVTKLGEGWYISGIRCSPGEFAPEREFSFEMEGFLLKSVVPPLDSKYWHLVFEQNGVQGNVVPLMFNAESMCTPIDGTQAVCDPTTFIEPSKALIQGEMTETGVVVKHLRLVP